MLNTTTCYGITIVYSSYRGGTNNYLHQLQGMFDA
jgi:hypothetical protein